MSYALGAVDLPRGRHRHAFPTARLGGVGFVLAFLLCILFFVPEKSNTVAAFFLSLPLLLAAGVLDDIFTLTPLWKLLLQISASAAALTALDIRGGFSVTASLLYILLLTNALNLIDGLDTLACGVGIISHSALAILLLRNFYTGGLLALLFSLSLFGFLPFNRHPARLFMGDTGAQAIGFTYAVLSLPLLERGVSLPTVLPMLYPIFELLSSFIRRICRGSSPFSADRGHLHHRLVDGGLSASRTATLLHLLTLFLSFLAWILI